MILSQIVNDIIYHTKSDANESIGLAKSSFGFSITSHRKESGSKGRSVVSDSLPPHGLYGPWNSLDQDTGVGSLSLLQGSSQHRDLTQVSHIAGRFFTS